MTAQRWSIRLLCLIPHWELVKRWAFWLISVLKLAKKLEINHHDLDDQRSSSKLIMSALADISIGGWILQDERLRMLGQRISRLRKNREMNQATFSAKVMIMRSYLSELENGKHNPSFTLLVRIVSVLDISLDQLYPQSYIRSDSDKASLPGLTKESLLNAVNGALISQIKKNQHSRIRSTLCWFLAKWWLDFKGRTMTATEIIVYCKKNCPHLQSPDFNMKDNILKIGLGSLLTSLSTSPLGNMKIIKDRTDRHIIYTLEKTE